MGFSKDSSGITRGSLGRILDRAGTGAQINQIRGVSVAGTTGVGIPKQVTNVSASVSNASTGNTCIVKVTYRRDATDKYFSGVQVFVRNYNGNAANVALASGSDSPITFVLNNTGENVEITVQATANSGAAPLDSSPTAGVKLPKSTSGGFGP